MAFYSKRTTLLILSIGFFLLSLGYGGPIPDSSVYTIRKLEGIPQNDVQCLYKDSRGFIWIGTLDGLHRYDGYDFQSYRVQRDGSGINSNLIGSVTEDPKGNIWIATYGKGICKLDPRTGKITNYLDHNDPVLSQIPDDIVCFEMTDHNELWLGTYQGLLRIRFDQAIEKVTEVVNVADTPHGINSIFLDKFGVLWAGSNGLLFKIPEPHNEPGSLTVEQLPYSSRSITESEDGLMAGGSMITSVCRYPELDSDEYHFFVIRSLEEQSSEVIDAICLKNGTNLWIGSRGGAKCLQKNADGYWVVTDVFNDTDSNKSLDSNIVTSIIDDGFDQIWVGTRSGGITILREKVSGFNSFSSSDSTGSLSNDLTRCMFVDHKDNLWVGTEEGGVNLHRSDSDMSYHDGFEHLQINPVASENRVYAIAEVMTPRSSLRDSLLYLGTSYPTNLAAVDPETLEVIPNPLGDNTIGFVFAIEVDVYGTLWVGTYAQGLWRFKTDQDGLIIDSKQFLCEPNDSQTVGSNIIRDLHLDQRGNLWVSTDKGLSIVESNELRSETPVFKRYATSEIPGSLPHDYILQIFESQTGDIWLGSMGGGLIHANGTPGVHELQFYSFTTADGLPNDSVKSIQEDEFGFLWLSSNNGMTKFNPLNKHITNFDIQDGLQDDEFSEICSAKRADGHLIFGGRNGFNAFYPNKIVTDGIPPKLFINRLFLSNKEVFVGDAVNGRVLLEAAVEYTDAIDLKYHENDISIGFVGIQYRSPQENQYLYKLEGYDEDWVPCRPELRVAKYTNLDAGEYIFKVKGSNSDGIWAEDSAVLKITISPPFWETIIFRVCAMVLTLLILATAYWRHVAHLHHQKEQLEQQVKERTQQLRELNNDLSESNAMKDKFFGILAHDLRSPFSSFMGLTEIMVDDIKSMPISEIQDLAKTLNHSSTELFNLLENLLHWARIQQGVVSFEPLNINFNLALFEVIEQHRDSAAQKNITLTNETPDDVFVLADQNVLQTVLRNLISNAIKFTRSGGTVRVYLDSRAETTARFAIEDTGIGMSETLLQELFRIDIKSNRLGTEGEASSGLGLILCKEFIQKVGGQLDVQSRENHGTTFYVTLPTATDPE